MNFNFLLGDVISKLNAGNRHRVKTIILLINNITLDILLLLLNLGLIRGFKLKNKQMVFVNLRFRGGFHLFYKLGLVSKPSNRIYWDLRNLYINIEKNTSLIYVISTKKGLLIGSDCLWQKLTGEVLFKIIL